MGELARVLTHPKFQGAGVVPMDPWVSKREVAVQLDVSTRTVDRWVCRGLPEEVPGRVGAWVVWGSRRRFRVGACKAWLMEGNG